MDASEQGISLTAAGESLIQQVAEKRAIRRTERLFCAAPPAPTRVRGHLIHSGRSVRPRTAGAKPCVSDGSSSPVHAPRHHANPMGATERQRLQGVGERTEGCRMSYESRPTSISDRRCARCGASSGWKSARSRSTKPSRDGSRAPVSHPGRHDRCELRERFARSERAFAHRLATERKLRGAASPTCIRTARASTRRSNVWPKRAISSSAASPRRPKRSTGCSPPTRSSPRRRRSAGRARCDDAARRAAQRPLGRLTLSREPQHRLRGAFDFLRRVDQARRQPRIGDRIGAGAGDDLRARPAASPRPPASCRRPRTPPARPTAPRLAACAR